MNKSKLLLLPIVIAGAMAMGVIVSYLKPEVHLPVRPILEKLPSNALILRFADSVRTGDAKQFETALSELETTDKAQLVDGFEKGELIKAWSVQTDRFVTHLLIEAKLEYKPGAKTRKEARAVFILILKGDKWVMDWYNPGAVSLKR